MFRRNAVLVTSKKFQHNMKGSIEKANVACIWVEAFAVILTGLSVYSVYPDLSVGTHNGNLPSFFDFDFDIDVLELSLG
jgi:hypothetical protein